MTTAPTPPRRLAPTGAARHVVTAGWAVAGLMLLSTAGLRWVETGPGSRFAGLELADSIRSGVLSPSWGVWVALAVYCLIGLGGVFIATAVIDHLAVVVPRGIIAVTGTTGFALLAVRAIPVADWAPGSTLAALSFFIATALTVVQLLIRSRN